MRSQQNEIDPYFHRQMMLVRRRAAGIHRWTMKNSRANFNPTRLRHCIFIQ